MLHVGEALQPEQFRHLHRAVLADLAEIIPQQIGNHDQLGQFFGARLELIGQLGVAGRRRRIGAGFL